MKKPGPDGDFEFEETFPAISDFCVVFLKGLVEVVEDGRNRRGGIGRRDHRGRRETGRKRHAVRPTNGSCLSSGLRPPASRAG